MAAFDIWILFLETVSWKRAATFSRGGVNFTFSWEPPPCSPIPLLTQAHAIPNFKELPIFDTNVGNPGHPGYSFPSGRIASQTPHSPLESILMNNHFYISIDSSGLHVQNICYIFSQISISHWLRKTFIIMVFRSLKSVFFSQIFITPLIENSPTVSYHHLPGNKKNAFPPADRGWGQENYKV